MAIIKYNVFICADGRSFFLIIFRHAARDTNFVFVVNYYQRSFERTSTSNFTALSYYSLVGMQRQTPHIFFLRRMQISQRWFPDFTYCTQRGENFRSIKNTTKQTKKWLRFWAALNKHNLRTCAQPLLLSHREISFQIYPLSDEMSSISWRIVNLIRSKITRLFRCFEALWRKMMKKKKKEPGEILRAKQNVENYTKNYLLKRN